MKPLKNMYQNIIQDCFPENLTLELGETRLQYHRRSWEIEGENRGLRYGENPDQPAAMYELEKGALAIGGISYKGPGQGLVSSLTEKNMLQAGKHPGKTNLTDVDNGITILQYLHNAPTAVILKHNNPCGAAQCDAGVGEALSKAFWADRIAAFGGAVVVNRPLDRVAAEVFDSAYFEVIAAPDFEEGVLDILKKRKNLRILCIPGLGCLEKTAGVPFLDIKSLSDGGLVLQQSFVNRIRSADDFLPAMAEKKGCAVIARKPTAQEADDLVFAWAVEAGVSSNSVIFAKGRVTTAIATGEQDRVGCVELAIHKARVKYLDARAYRERGISLYELTSRATADAAEEAFLREIQARALQECGGLAGSVMVSDGFFPFRDGVDAAIRQGVTAIAQPGGSLRDHEVIEAVNEATPQVAMAFTGQRSFRH